MELIDKDAVVAEIEKQGTIQPQLSWFTDKLIQIINDSVEVKEVDLKKEFSQWWKDERAKDYNVDILYERYPNVSMKLAKHFFELGIAVSNKTQKGE